MIGNGATGRNGGHLTPFFGGFCARTKLYGADNALRAALLEIRTVSAIVDLVRQHDSVSDVNLVEGGHNVLLFTQAEADALRADFEAAKSSGLKLAGYEWLKAEEVQRVWTLALCLVDYDCD